MGPGRARDLGLRAEDDVIAPSKLGKGGRDVASTPRKPFAGALRVEARPVASDQRLEASLASNGATRPAKRRQRARTPCYSAPKDLSWEPLLFTYRGTRRCAVPVWCQWSCRRRLNTANGQSVFRRNLGDLAVSSATSRPEPPGHQLQATAAHSSAAEREEGVDAEVPPSEGNEVRRDGRQGVVAL
jgi:hypothetical protein